MPIDNERSTVIYPLYVLSFMELSVVGSLRELEREFESYDLSDDDARIYDSKYRRVKVGQDKPFQENSFTVTLDSRFTPVQARLALRSECIEMCLGYQDDDVTEDSDRLFVMDQPELLSQVARLREEFHASSAAWASANKKPRRNWFNFKWLKRRE